MRLIRYNEIALSNAQTDRNGTYRDDEIPWDILPYRLCAYCLHFVTVVPIKGLVTWNFDFLLLITWTSALINSRVSSDLGHRDTHVMSPMFMMQIRYNEIILRNVQTDKTAFFIMTKYHPLYGVLIGYVCANCINKNVSIKCWFEMLINVL